VYVKIYCATVEVSSVTAPRGQYYDITLSVCSGDHDRAVASDVGWASTHSNSGNGEVKGKLNLWKNKEPGMKVIFDGIEGCTMFQETVGLTLWQMGLNLCVKSTVFK
jgi:hypothetical protein